MFAISILKIFENFKLRLVNRLTYVNLVIGALLPFSVVESPTYRKHINYEPTSRNNLTRYLEKLTSRVDRKIAAQLPLRFAIVFDRWSNGDIHYVACYASYPSTNENGFCTELLRLFFSYSEKNLTIS